ncbi:MAG: FAD-binding oxidoreductase [Myxococcota bacterium]
MRAPITDPSVIDGYLSDASNTRGHAEALVRPESTEEVAETMRHCQSRGIPLTITAARTSTTAAPVPFGGWLLSTERLNAVRGIGLHDATAQAGVYLGEFQAQIEETGRFFPPDPTSRHECTLGAAIACNASGARSFRYGPTRPWVQSIEVVTATGRVLTADRNTPIPRAWPRPNWTRPTVKTAAGFEPAQNLLDVFIGQEGSLGLITQATVRLTDLPDEVLGIFAYFPSRDAAVRFVDAARTAGRSHPEGAVSPRALEYLDHHCLSYVRERVGHVPDGATCALFCEQEVCIDADAHLTGWWELLGACAGELADETVVTDTDAGTRRLHELRHAVPAGINERVVANGMPKVGTDLAVPDAHLSQILDLYEACPLPHATFGHIGDNHLHCNVLPRTAEELEQAKRWYVDVAHHAIQMGGTISAEHGVGKLKTELLAQMVGTEVLEQFQSLKRHLDPAWILGRGTVLRAPNAQID